ncbi:hypothetical protein BCR44DRAFT_1173422 [Catenaria anguillulae PL171]|uniref:acetate--CoA ligase n=1 Tax=Catenaria anguillulae PL171 TaxID=765915 RepID=A0A1Y2I4L4_9FUNG|nr:hypothetical protein BCR44DRAFT_1173422 [Catenaria anguillulae PL171]
MGGYDEISPSLTRDCNLPLTIRRTCPGIVVQHARDILTWSTPFSSILSGSFHHNNTDIDPIWFPEGKLNATYNCIDRHALVNPDKLALVHEPDNPNESVTKVTYGQLLRQVSQLANALHDMGLRKGDTVCIYMPMVIETIVAMLACARLGLVHSVVFAGFSAESLRDRLNNGNCKCSLLPTKACAVACASRSRKSPTKLSSDLLRSATSSCTSARANHPCP